MDQVYLYTIIALKYVSAFIVLILLYIRGPVFAICHFMQALWDSAFKNGIKSIQIKFWSPHINTRQKCIIHKPSLTVSLYQKGRAG